jgi:hypothetical protein
LLTGHHLRGASSLLLLGQLAMRVVGIAARPASRKEGSQFLARAEPH